MEKILNTLKEIIPESILKIVVVLAGLIVGVKTLVEFWSSVKSFIEARHLKSNTKTRLEAIKLTCEIEALARQHSLSHISIPRDIITELLRGSASFNKTPAGGSKLWERIRVAIGEYPRLGGFVYALSSFIGKSIASAAIGLSIAFLQYLISQGDYPTRDNIYRLFSSVAAGMAVGITSFIFIPRFFRNAPKWINFWSTVVSLFIGLGTLGFFVFLLMF